ncbi:MAG: hypothetical protein HYR84_11565 [Planctomycetes bacterium]|nr:hypothetical protein [Planctomycetota bacterium]
MRFFQDTCSAGCPTPDRQAARRWLLGILMALAALPLLGCSRDDDITQETVTFQDREPIRLRVAIIEHKDIAWFLRIEGPAALMKEHEAAFDAFVKSSRITDAKEPEMTWTVPANWKKDPPAMGRYATFRIEAKPKELEIKITQLSAKGLDFMANMHRWQKQVNVALSEKLEEAQKYVTYGKTDLGVGVKYIDMTGLAVHTVSKPAAVGAAKDHDLLGQMHADDPGKLPFTYTVPERKGWTKKAKLPTFALDAYDVPGGVDVTLTPAGGRLSDNVARWRTDKEIGLSPGKPQEIVDSIADIKVAGGWAYYVDISNPEGPATRKRILGVIVPLEQSRWFIKMTGPHDQVGQRKQEFETFVQSFKRS